MDGIKKKYGALCILHARLLRLDSLSSQVNSLKALEQDPTGYQLGMAVDSLTIREEPGYD